MVIRDGDVIRPALTIEIIGAAAARYVVVIITAIDRVVLLAADDGIVTRAANQPVSLLVNTATRIPGATPKRLT